DNGTVALSPYYRAGSLDLSAVVSGTSIFWVNGAGGDWDTATNWSTGVVPVSTDNAFISISSSAVITHNTSASDTVNKLTSYESLSIANGTLTILGTSTIYGPLSLLGGTLNANGSITTAGGFSWTAGTLGGTSGLANSGGLSLGT